MIDVSNRSKTNDRSASGCWTSRGAIAAAAVLLSIALPFPAQARYPQISPIPDIAFPWNASGPLMRFSLADDDTAPDDLVLEVRSDNPDLVPPDDDHITIGGSGQDRTIVVTPVPGAYGYANITVIATDKDGDKARETFQIQVQRPPNI